MGSYDTPPVDRPADPPEHALNKAFGLIFLSRIMEDEATLLKELHS